MVLLLSLPAGAAPGFTWKSLGSGAEWRIHRLSDGSGRQLFLTRWDPARADLKVVTASQFGARSLGASDFLSKSGALAVCNGGYFDPAQKALGLLFDGSWRQPQAAGGSAFGGMFSLTGTRPRMEPIYQLSEAEYQARRGASDLRFLIQCGPRLLADGVAVSGLEKGTVTRRTALGYDAQGRLILLASGATSLLTFAELQGAVRDQLGWVSGLNLDGGSSTASAVRRGPVNEGYSAVPFMLAVQPRR